ncbi:hypothetical protein V8E53_011098 [Lactarius tabidus]
MPPKPREEELSSVEIMLLHGAARLLTAVKWIAEHPPLPEKWGYLNEKVMEEIMCQLESNGGSSLALHNLLQHREAMMVLTAVSHKGKLRQNQEDKLDWYYGRQERNANLRQNQEDKLVLLRTLQGILYTTRTELLTNLLKKDVHVRDTPPPVTTGLLTHSCAQKVEAPTAAPITPPASPSMSTYAGKGKKCAAPPEDSPEVETHSNEGDTPQKVTEIPPGVAVPSVLVEGASPPRPKAPATTGDDHLQVLSRSQEDMPQAEAPMGSPHFQCHAWMYFVPSPAGQGLNEDTQHQLNRIEAMLSGICASKGIIPETLPGYERRRSASPSSLSPSSPGMHMETLNILDTHSNTSAHSSNSSEPPRKVGEAVPPSEVDPGVAQSPPIRVDRHWEELRAHMVLFQN